MELMFPLLAILTVGLLCILVLLLKLYRQGKWQLHHLEKLRPPPLLLQQQAEGRAYLHGLLQWDQNMLPPLGGWAASADMLIVLAETMLANRPQRIVEFGSGVTTLVLLRCIELNRTGHLTSFDNDAHFAGVVERRAARLGYSHRVDVVALKDADPLGWPGRWYDHPPFQPGIDLIVIDGPPVLNHEQTRGGAESTFAALSPGGVILLDDANRWGERAIADRWRREHPGIRFDYLDLEKGLLIGHKVDAQ
ncbi:O-methyltransferase [Pacificimonas sp. ICDLI1SI03]